MLTPVVFTIYISDMAEEVNSHLSLSADDDKLQWKIGTDGNGQALQQGLDRIFEWSRGKETEFYSEKL